MVAPPYIEYAVYYQKNGFLHILASIPVLYVMCYEGKLKGLLPSGERIEYIFQNKVEDLKLMACNADV